MHATCRDTVGGDMHALITRLYPICRSITGNGVRETLRILREQIPIEIREVPSGTQVFDWTVPREWNIRDAWIKNRAGERIVDFQKLNLHVVSYSVPINRKMRLAELRDHLFTVTDHSDWVPYRTSYYTESWGFCLSENQLSQLRETEQYDVCIDSSLENGHLTYGEYLLKGQQSEEVLISSHICHPSLANDNLSGIAIAVELARHLASSPRRYSYRFLFIPGTIGSITWLSQNENVVKRIRHGLVLTCVGDAGNITYKRSRRGNAEIDRAFIHVLKHSGDPHKVIDFFPYGYDERQYCSPGFNLPVGCMMRSPHGQCPEYHTSGDNLAFVRPQALADSLEKCRSVIDLLESNRIHINQQSKCEPQLGRRGLYTGLGSADERRRHEMALLWVLNLSDSEHDLLAIAERADVPFSEIKVAADALSRTGLLKEAPPRRINGTPANDRNNPTDDMKTVGATYRA
jgi:aminopeptidase-like protein